MRRLGWIILFSLLASPAAGQITNPDFESGFDGWTVEDEGSSAALSNEAKSGLHAAKLSAKSGLIKQTLAVQPGQYYTLSADLRGSALLGVKVDGRLYFDRHKTGKKWKTAGIKFQSGQASSAIIFASHDKITGRLDNFSLSKAVVFSDQKLSHFILSKSSGGTGLSPSLPPSENFDLSKWYLSIPVDKNKDGKSDSLYEGVLNRGFVDDRFFFTAEDGGMTFRAPVAGAKTSKNTAYTRTELREMLRAGDKNIPTAKPGKNNWVLESASDKAKSAAGAIGGHLSATLTVDHVTTTGESHEAGRVIIGQIHGWKNEPIRLYYRRLPGHQKGSLYFAHERQTGRAEKRDDTYYDLIGSRKANAPEPEDGIALGEKFSYEIDITGNLLSVSISKAGVQLASKSMDISQSGYAIDEEYLYFKAGVYNQNKTGRADDYVQATFYALETSH